MEQGNLSLLEAVDHSTCLLSLHARTIASISVSACKPNCRAGWDVQAPGQLLLMRQAQRVSPPGNKTSSSPARVILCALPYDTQLRYSSQCDPDTAPEGIWS